MSFREIPTNLKGWIIYMSVLIIYLFIIMLISGLIWFYEIDIVMIFGIPLDLGYGIMVGSGIFLFIFSAYFITTSRRRSRSATRGNSMDRGFKRNSRM